MERQQHILERNKTVGKIKQQLIDNNLDVTDDREPTATSEPTISDEMTASDHYYLELFNAITNLQVLKPYGYIDELKYCSYLLNELVAEMEQPF